MNWWEADIRDVRPAKRQKAARSARKGAFHSDAGGEAVKDPIEAIEKLLEKRGWTRRYLEPALGSRSKVSEVMNRKRPLSISMIRCLVFNYRMDAKTMIQWYPTEMQPVEPVGIHEAIVRAQREHAEPTP
jgi:antitoxin component HigA of HigAB toxin-antitoxin module